MLPAEARNRNKTSKYGALGGNVVKSSRSEILRTACTDVNVCGSDNLTMCYICGSSGMIALTCVLVFLSCERHL